MSFEAATAGPERLSQLTEEQCFELLAQAEIGRLAYTDRALPVITPVTYSLDGNRLLFRTKADGHLLTCVQNTVVAFEVDEIDSVSRTGWSVLVTGVARRLVDRSELVLGVPAAPEPWAGGARQAVVEITPGLISGRIIAA
jgi:nitroimidazol reductase NimA-like FMN-containing flavoprotein (pyridoxamine 5'-phosphate oxidase superfamily)